VVASKGEKLMNNDKVASLFMWKELNENPYEPTIKYYDVELLQDFGSLFPKGRHFDEVSLLHDVLFIVDNDGHEHEFMLQYSLTH